MFDVFDISSDFYFLLGNGIGVFVLIAVVWAGATRHMNRLSDSRVER